MKQIRKRRIEESDQNSASQPIRKRPKKEPIVQYGENDSKVKSMKKNKVTSNDISSKIFFLNLTVQL